MTDGGLITNKILLEHIQAGKLEVLHALQETRNELSQLKHRVDRLEIRMKEGFEEARQDRQILREDLEATILTQFKQGKQIAVLAGKSMPEEY